MKKFIYVVFDNDRSAKKAYTNEDMAEQACKELNDMIWYGGGCPSATVKKLELVEGDGEND